MKYIRFLKPPRIDGGQLKALITITSDLGDSLLAEEVDLHASLCSEDISSSVHLTQTITWTTYSRALPISIDLAKARREIWPARLYVGAFHQAGPDALSNLRNPDSDDGILSAFSSTINPHQDIMCADRVVERRLKTEVGELHIWEETGESIARHVWDAGLALAAHLQTLDARGSHGRLRILKEVFDGSSQKPLKVIELGSGTGIVGISVAKSYPSAEVIMTDLPEAEEMVRRNVAANALSSNVSFTTIDWEHKELPQAVLDTAFDVVVFADCTYNADSSPYLIQTLVRLMENSPSAKIVAAMKDRHPSESVFFELMEESGFRQTEHWTLAIPPKAEEQIEVYLFVH